MEQSTTWGSNIGPNSQNTELILWNGKAHTHFHKTSPLLTIRSQINPLHALTFYQLPFACYYPISRYSTWFLFSQCSRQTLHALLFSPTSTQCPAHLYTITQRAKFKKHLIMTFSPNPRYFLLLSPQDLLQPRTARNLCAPWTGQ
jgi:hypothetical protein